MVELAIAPLVTQDSIPTVDDWGGVSPGIWRYWQAATIVSSVTGSTWDALSGSTWDAWASDYVAYSGSSSNNCSVTLPWRSWNGAFVNDNGYGVDYVASARKIARAARAVERVAAEAKAKKILSEHLSKEQVHELEHKGYFHVVVGKGDRKRRYRVERKAQHNVYLLDREGKVEREFCTILPECPLEDQLLVQKLYLETDEKAFYEAANVWDHRGGLRDNRVLPRPEKINRLRALLDPEEARILLPA